MTALRIAAIALAWTLVATASAAQPGLLTVTAMTPAPGSTVTVLPSTVTVTLSSAPDPVSVNSGTVRVVRPGADTILGTADDVPVRADSVTLLGSTITIILAGQTLPNGVYGVFLSGTEAVIPDFVNHWKLDESGAATTAADSVGALPGTVTGANWSWTTGRMGNAWQNLVSATDDKITMSGAALGAPWTARCGRGGRTPPLWTSG